MKEHAGASKLGCPRMARADEDVSGGAKDDSEGRKRFAGKRELRAGMLD